MPYKRKSLKQPHQKKLLKNKAQTGRTVDNSNMYQTQRWRRFRRNYLDKHPLCVHCQKKGKTTAAQVLDHITPVRLGGAFYDLDNVQGLCNTCHNIKSAKERHLTGYAPKITRV